MQIISYNFIILKHIQINSHFRKILMLKVWLSFLGGQYVQSVQWTLVITSTDITGFHYNKVSLAVLNFGFPLYCIVFVTVTLYGWWLLEEGTSRNVPIAGFEMILREDYKSRDEVEGLYILPEISFQTPRYWEHSVMFPTTKSPSVILYGYPLPPLPCPASA